MQRHWSAVFITLLFILTSQSVLAQSLDPAYLTFGGGLILLLILTFYVIKQILCTRQISQNPYPIRVLPS